MNSLKSDAIRKIFGAGRRLQAVLPDGEMSIRPTAVPSDNNAIIVYSEVAVKGNFKERLRSLLEQEFNKWGVLLTEWESALEASHQRWMERASHWVYDPSLWVPEDIEASIWENYRDSVEFDLLYRRNLPMEFIPRPQDIQSAQDCFYGWLGNNGWGVLQDALAGKDPHAFFNQILRVGQDLLRERSLAEGSTTYKNFVDKYGAAGAGGGSAYPDLTEEAVRLSTSPEYQKHFPR